MISVITAVHNQLAMNKLFWTYLKKNTFHSFELIIIDNVSTDGSAEFFESVGAKVIRNDANYSYPHSQNQGIRAARYDIFAFLNNDLIVPRNWDKTMSEIARKHRLDVWALSSIDRLETPEFTRKMRNRWKAVRNPLLKIFGNKGFNLRLMLYLMYGSWDKFTERRRELLEGRLLEGIAGSAVIATRRGIEKVGFWDERIQTADFDIFLRTKERSVKVGDIRPPVVLLGVFCHHYARLTQKYTYPPFADKDNLIKLTDKWDTDYANILIKDTHMAPDWRNTKIPVNPL